MATQTLDVFLSVSQDEIHQEWDRVGLGKIMLKYLMKGNFDERVLERWGMHFLIDIDAGLSGKDKEKEIILHVLSKWYFQLYSDLTYNYSEFLDEYLRVLQDNPSALDGTCFHVCERGDKLYVCSHKHEGEDKD